MASQQITEEAVYLCTGNPLPKDIEQISYWLLNEQYSESFKSIHDYFQPFIDGFDIYNHFIILICINFKQEYMIWKQGKDWLWLIL